MRAPAQGGALAAAPESLLRALVRVYDTGQRLMLDRIELARLELIAFARGDLVVLARHLARGLVLAVAGGALLLAGWFTLSWGLVNLVAAALPPPWRLVIEAALNIGAGAVLLGLASRASAPLAQSPPAPEEIDP